MVSSSVENELDIPLLISRLWRGKGWIAGLAIVGILLAVAYAKWAPQVWSATAIVDRPSVSQIAAYYSQQQSLASLEDNSTAGAAAITDEVYQEFLLQLSSWDSRRDFWQQSDYYRRQLSGHQAHQARILNKLINSIRFQAAEPVRGTRDTLILQADNAALSAELLNQYVHFASQRAVRALNSNLSEEWKNAWQLHQRSLARQQSVAESSFDQQRRQLELAINNGGNGRGEVASSEPHSFTAAISLPELHRMLNNLLINGPVYSSQYLQEKALLAGLKPDPDLSDNIQVWRYLRSPEPPVSRESPRLLLLIVLWGVTGAFAGAVIAISRRSVR